MKNKMLIAVAFIFFVLLLLGKTYFYENLWALATCNAYFIPKESNIFVFNATQISNGSNEIWLYGEDNKYYYGLNIEPDYTPSYFKLKKGNETIHFYKYDYKTWR